MASHSNTFFVVGGTLGREAASYVRRPVDDELLRRTMNGEYCNVLAARQTGKSSLMVRTSERLKREGVRSVIIDLTSIGSAVSPSEWYFGLLSRLSRELGLKVDEQDWWQSRSEKSPVQRFSDFLREIVLEEIQESIVVFVDEIDSTLKLGFTDDFFAAIRAAYNARSNDPTYERMTFVLLGVARPADLIKDRTRTPYNIGINVDVTDFTLDEMDVFTSVLDQARSGQGKQILGWALDWTGGQPYLTQKLCAEVVEGADGNFNKEKLGELVESLFLGDKARTETNLRSIRDRVSNNPYAAKMLRIYKRVLAGKQVVAEDQSIEQNELKLTGLVKVSVQGFLQVRNRIYARIFDAAWARENTPVTPAQRLSWAVSIIAVLAIGVAGFFFYRQQVQAVEIQAQTYIDSFNTSQSAEVRITSLAGLFYLGDEYAPQGQELFNSLSNEEQLALFNLATPENVGSELYTAVEGLYQEQRNTPESNEILQRMASQLEQTSVPGATSLTLEINAWLDGREQADQENYSQAITFYTNAWDKSQERDQANPGVLFDLGIVYTVEEKFDLALANFDDAVGLDEKRLAEVEKEILSSQGLADQLRDNATEYPNLDSISPPAIIITPTPIITQWNSVNSLQNLSQYDEIQAIAVDPKNERTIYIGTRNAGLYKSTNGGGSWVPSQAGIERARIETILIDSQDSNLLLVRAYPDFIYRSTDAGATWELAIENYQYTVPLEHPDTGSLPDWIAPTLAADPRDGQHFYLTARNGYYQTTDGGESWGFHEIKCPMFPIALDVHPFESNSLFMAEIAENGCETGIYLITDSNLSSPTSELIYSYAGYRQRSFGNVFQQFYDRFEYIKTDIQNGIVYAGGGKQRLQFSNDGGTNWTESSYTCDILAVRPQGRSAMFCSGSDLGIAGDIVERSGQNWDRITRPFSEVVSAISFFSSNSQSFLIGGPGIFITKDNGQTWPVLSGELPISGFDLYISNTGKNHLYLVEGGWCSAWGGYSRYNSNLYGSEDGGSSWKLLSKEGCGLAIDADGSTLYRHTLNELFVSRDNGENWNRTLPISPQALASLPNEPGQLYSVTTQFGDNQTFDINVKLVTSYGQEYREFVDLKPLNGTLDGKILNFYVAPSNKDLIYAVAAKGDFSKLSNEKWQQCISSPYRDEGNDRWHVAPDTKATVAIHPQDEQRLYVATSGNGVQYSGDGCNTWEARNNGLGNLYINAVAIDPNEPNIIYAGTDNGAYISENDGELWEPLNLGLDSGYFKTGIVYSIVIANDSTVYALIPDGLFTLEP